MTDQPDPQPPHIYVPQGQFPAPANINEPALVHLDVAHASLPRGTDARSAMPSRLQVLTDLPDKLPVLPQEVALIRAYLPTLLALIAANDNDPSHV